MSLMSWDIRGPPPVGGLVGGHLYVMAYTSRWRRYRTRRRFRRRGRFRRKRFGRRRGFRRTWRGSRMRVGGAKVVTSRRRFGRNRYNRYGRGKPFSGFTGSVSVPFRSRPRTSGPLSYKDMLATSAVRTVGSSFGRKLFRYGTAAAGSALTGLFAYMKRRALSGAPGSGPVITGRPDELVPLWSRIPARIMQQARRAYSYGTPL